MDLRQLFSDWWLRFVGAQSISLSAVVRRHQALIHTDPGSQIRTEIASTNDVQVTCLDVTRLGKTLGWPVAGTIPVDRRKPVLHWKMESDDAAILASIYRHHKPLRHLEFGTWEGFGSTLCAANCDAEIWTINLPEGERTERGTLVYHRQFQSEEYVPAGAVPSEVIGSNTFYQTDSGPFIGWRYRKAGVSDRVHQILADSCAWDTQSFSDGFFNSVLVDGGHRSDVVINDTEKALRLLRVGGLMMWHDFCPVDKIMQSKQAARGVVNAIHARWNKWAPQFDNIFWIWPSQLLVGRRR